MNAPGVNVNPGAPSSGHHWGRSFISNLFWATWGEAVTRVLKVLQIFFVVRWLGPKNYGEFVFAFSFVTVFSILFDSGLVITITREMARDPDNGSLLGDVILLKALLGGIGFAAIFIGSTWITREPLIRNMILVLGLNQFLGEILNLSYGIFRARMLMKYESFIRIGQAILLFAAVMAALFIFGSSLSVAVAYLITTAVAVGALVFAGRRFFQSLQLTPRWRALARLMRIALPLALAGGVSSLYMNIDAVLLGWWKSMEAVGWYDAADRLNSVSLLPLSLLLLVALPAFASLSTQVDDDFRRRWNTWSTALVVLAVFTAVAILARAPEITVLIFGSKFGAAVPVLRIMAATGLLIYLYMPSYQALVIFDRQNALFIALAVALVVNVALNVYLIPIHGIEGAAVATVGTHGVILIELCWLASVLTPLKPVNAPITSALLACAVSGLAAFAVMRADCFRTLFVAIPIGGAVYSAILWALLKVTSGRERGWTFSFSNYWA